jgi:hypothetical protein
MIRRRHGWLCIVVIAGWVLGLAGSVAAQQSDPDFWGSGTNIEFVSAEEFNPSDNRHYEAGFYNYWYTGAVSAEVRAPLNLPTGALVQGFRVIYDDNIMAADIGAEFRRSYYHLSTGPGGEVIESWMSSGAPGYASAWVDVDPDITIAHRYETFFGPGYASYYFQVTLSVEYTGLRGVLVLWNRQISPAPAVATFADVPVGAFGFQHIEALAASGISAGCGGGNFCPNDTLTRAQMAVFLAKALGLHWAS